MSKYEGVDGFADSGKGDPQFLRIGLQLLSETGQGNSKENTHQIMSKYDGDGD